MAWILMLIGLIIGAGLAGMGGALLGGALGFALGRIARMSGQIQALIADQLLLREELKTLRAELEDSGARSPEPTGTQAESAAEAPRSSVASETVAASPTEDEIAESGHRVQSSVPPSMTPKAMDVEPAAEAAAEPGIPLAGRIYRFLTEGNVVAKIGVIVLFFGLAFLLKYAADRDWFPIGARLSLVGAGALALLAIGWLLRRRHGGYALVLQGGGVGLLYLTLYAAMRLYGLLSPGLTFGLMLLVVAGAALLAVIQDARSLAVLGIVGGFLAPILAGSESGNHHQLFGYYLLLDLGIVAIAWCRAWRDLNLLGFLFTFVIGTVWGVLQYKPALFATTEPYLIGFYLIFLATAILFARRQRAEGRHDYVQSSLVFGPPLVGFGLQAMLVRDFEYGLAWSALALGLLYFLAFAWLLRLSERYRLLRDAFLALGIGFLSLAVPLALDGQWTSTTWSLEGAAMLWIGLRQNKPLPVWFGLLLLFAAGIALSLDPPAIEPDRLLLDGFFLSAALVAFSSFLSGYLLRARPMAGVLVAWSAIWWFGTGFAQLDQSSWPTLGFPSALSPVLVFVTATVLGLTVWRLWLERRYGAEGRWPVLNWLPALLGAFMMLAGSASVLTVMRYPFEQGGWWAWPLAFAVFYGLLWWHERRGEPVAWRETLHTGVFWLLALLLAPQVAAWLYGGLFGLTPDLSLAHGRLVGYMSAPGAWAVMSWGLVPALLLVWSLKARHWPFAERFGHVVAYRGRSASGLAAYLVLWLLAVNGLWLTEDDLGRSWAVPGHIAYLPILNGPDLVSLVILTVLMFLVGRQREYLSDRLQRVGGWWLGAAAFIWLNALIARCLNAYAHLSLRHWRFLDDSLAQATYSIVWSLLGLVLIVLASRWRQRRLWLVAAGLLGVVVAKLFLVDLSGTNTLARIVSFVGVGLLLLLAGYVAPIPGRGTGKD